MEAKDIAYWERNQLVAALSRLFPSLVGVTAMEQLPRKQADHAAR
jgi:hypothetical protein